MKIALVADLHGNLPATLAVDADISRRGVDAIYCLGDIVGKGPDSPMTMDWAMDNCDIVLAGNWDIRIAAYTAGDESESARWYANQLGDERLRRLQALPMEHRFVLSGRRIRLLHGRPITPSCVFHDSPNEERLALFDVPDRPQMVGFADVHRPFYEHIDGAGTLFNIGSVGNSLSQTYASYTILEGAPGGEDSVLTHSIISVAYDRGEAVRRARMADGLPRCDAYVNEIRTGMYSR